MQGQTLEIGTGVTLTLTGPMQFYDCRVILRSGGTLIVRRTLPCPASTALPFRALLWVPEVDFLTTLSRERESSCSS